MRLSNIKLAGFKSFVDPTTLQFPGNLTGIIGPNGCGKSNTIDAVRWVMGESSAKHLRGESMDDVIFSGSASRKPVGQAHVELIFDNSDGKLEGPYAKYNEISVKRLVTRDGQSKYFLNGTRCRRRDIADLFLGTGLGPRSYAIIEQGMISRLIEAKPEELRVFLEEAAGISKYKERRRETETRIRHTRENLERLDDLREEITKHLAHLQRQARTAERYKEFKQEERQAQAEHLALRWRHLDGEVTEKEGRIHEQETRLEEAIAEQREVETRIVKQRELREQSQKDFNQIQSRFYSLGSDISRIEQNIQHQQQDFQRRSQDLEQLEASLQEAEATLQHDRNALQEAVAMLAENEPLLERQREAQSQSNQALQQAEQTMQDWQTGWEDYNRRAAEPTQQAQVERTRMEQLEHHIQQLQQRLQRLNDEKQQLVSDELESELRQLNEQADIAGQKKTSLEQAVSEVIQGIQRSREDRNQIIQQLNEQRRQLNDTRGRLASLEALQQAALGKDQSAVSDWLEQQGLKQARRLAETLTVEAGWEKAVETVLAEDLNGIQVDNLASLSDSIATLEQGSVTLFDSQNAASQPAADSLAQKIITDWPMGDLLSGIKVADDLADALVKRGSLGAGESIITRDGLWLGPNWLRVSREQDETSGVLAREQEIRELQQQAEAGEAQVKLLETSLADCEQGIQQQEQQREQQQGELNQAHSEFAQIQAQITARQSRLEQMSKRAQKLNEETAELGQQISNEEAAMEQARRKRNEAMVQMEELSREREQRMGQRESLQTALQESRSRAQSEREKAHEIAIQIESRRTARSSLEQNIQRMTSQLEQQRQRREGLQTAIAQGEAPIQQLQQELEQFLEQRLQVEAQLNEARKGLEDLDNELRQLEQQRQDHEQKSQLIRTGLEQARLNTQEVKVRCKTVKEQLDETDYQLEALLESLGDDARISDWERRLEDLAQKISRLGPINLAAIDEFQEEQKRKEYLDAQHADVTEALDTLEKAIAKIDKETRSRFKDTYEHVNTRLQEMFPRLFGGGQAYLEMTGDDLLNTGVAVMARPPGKRISHIQLMSGGEKALTAVALVFAIFELNPAPFCMLDEVDAPLDEANVGRFCDLVRDMSKRVQFIFITHNKTTMEMSDQLTGVTMREAGVSRLVSVDVDEATRMVAQA